MKTDTELLNFHFNSIYLYEGIYFVQTVDLIRKILH